MKLDLLAIFWNLVPVIATAVLHSGGTLIIVAERPRMFSLVSRRKLLRGEFVIVIILIQLLILHLIEMAVWGFWLRAMGLFKDVGTALYFAGICYTTLGYNGVIPANGGAVTEVVLGMMGMLMFGWSIGILVTTVMRYEKLALDWDAAGL